MTAPCDGRPFPEGKLVDVGDGYSDGCTALAATRVYARDGLACYLDEQGVAYTPFEDLRDIA